MYSFNVDIYIYKLYFCQLFQTLGSLPQKKANKFARIDQGQIRGIPVGFFNYNIRHIIGCNYTMMRSREIIMPCLQNRRMLFIGDSTVYRWFKTLTGRLKLHYERTLHHSPSVNAPYGLELRDTEHNFFAEFLPHSTPLTMQKQLVEKDKESKKDKESPRINTITPSIAAYLDELEGNSSAIVVFHLYGHIVNYPTPIFQSRIAHARDAVERLYARAPNVQVFIKGPHAFHPPDWYLTHDIYAKVYSDMIHSAFVKLRDQVRFLDTWDMSVGMGEYHDIHPNKVVADAMVDQLLAYIC
jgi:hypothetical protein